jgi:hypothetical protein
MAIAGKSALIKITSATPTTEGTVAMSEVSTGKWQITTVSKRHFDVDESTHPNVYVNTTLQASSHLSNINYVQGIVEFTTAGGRPTLPLTGDTVTADISYLTAASVAGGRDWTLDVNADMFEISQFSSSTGESGWKQYQPSMNGATITINRYHQTTGAEFFDRIVTDQKTLVELWVDGATSTGPTSGKYETFAYVTSDQAGAAVDSIVGESVQLAAHGAVYYSTE